MTTLCKLHVNLLKKQWGPIGHLWDMPVLFQTPPIHVLVQTPPIQAYYRTQLFWSRPNDQTMGYLSISSYRSYIKAYQNNDIP